MWASMLIYCTVYDIGGGGPHEYFFQGAPNPLATALVTPYVFEFLSERSLHGLALYSVINGLMNS